MVSIVVTRFGCTSNLLKSINHNFNKQQHVNQLSYSKKMLQDLSPAKAFKKYSTRKTILTHQLRTQKLDFWILQMNRFKVWKHRLFSPLPK